MFAERSLVNMDTTKTEADGTDMYGDESTNLQDVDWPRINAKVNNIFLLL
jgi:hypothetical protein